MKNWKAAAKFWVALVYAILVSVNQVVTSGAVQHWLTIALAVLGAVTVYLVPNQPAASTS